MKVTKEKEQEYESLIDEILESKGESWILYRMSVFFKGKMEAAKDKSREFYRAMNRRNVLKGLAMVIRESRISKQGED